jgi:hypothetical protein
MTIVKFRFTLQPFTFEFPRADIHELLSPDLLHQLIKGTFKDHLVTWINEYLIQEHGIARGSEIIDDIDRRYVSFIWRSIYSNWYVGSLLSLHSQACGDFQMDVISSSGPETTQKRS